MFISACLYNNLLSNPAPSPSLPPRCRHIATALGNSCHGDPHSICNPEGQSAAAAETTLYNALYAREGCWEGQEEKGRQKGRQRGRGRVGGSTLEWDTADRTTDQILEETAHTLEPPSVAIHEPHTEINTAMCLSAGLILSSSSNTNWSLSESHGACNWASSSLTLYFNIA